MAIPIALPGLKPSIREQGFGPGCRLGADSTCWHSDSTHPDTSRPGHLPSLHISSQRQAASSHSRVLGKPSLRALGPADSVQGRLPQTRVPTPRPAPCFPRDKQRAWTSTARCVLIFHCKKTPTTPAVRTMCWFLLKYHSQKNIFCAEKPSARN